MKKVFVSQPFGNKTREELKENAGNATRQLEDYLGEELELIDTWIDEDCPDDVERIPVWYLGKSIELLANADILLTLEGSKWARGCKVEEKVAKEYEIAIYRYEYGLVYRERMSL